MAPTGRDWVGIIWSYSISHTDFYVETMNNLVPSLKAVTAPISLLPAMHMAICVYVGVGSKVVSACMWEWVVRW